MKKKIIGIILAGAVLLSGTLSFAQTNNSTAQKFNDISTHWSKDAVQKLIKKNAIPFSQDKFLPGKAIKRSEFAVMLHTALDLKIEYFKQPDIKDYFNDVKQDATYSQAVIDLVTCNIIEGKGSFKPEASLTREEMVHYIMQAFKYKMGDIYKYIKIGPATFKDTSAINPIYGGDVAIAQHYKLISGNNNNLFQPKKATTRAEAAVIINKLVELIEKQTQQVEVIPSAVVTADSIEMKLVLKNLSKSKITIEFTSGQKFDFQLLDANRDVLYTWSADKMFIMDMSTTTIEAGKTLEFSDTLSGDSFKAIKDKVVYLKGYITGNANFINKDGYEIKLK